MNGKHWLRAGLLALLLAVTGCTMMGDHMSRPAPTQDGSKGGGGSGY
ncbi:hypothetical protein [Pseudogulbenkiania sp. MAI-1]|nr:hypothetical protein [Pseudogulbenkiania sp. MAI-1]